MARLRMNAGRFKMKDGRMATSCADCEYVASDGSTYTDDFNSALDASWVQADGSWSTSGGRLIADGAQEPHTIYQVEEPTADITLMIIEVDIYQLDGSDLLMFLEDAPPGTGGSFNITADWANNEIDWSTPGGGNTVSATLNDGDKLTIKVVRQGDGNYLACFFHNETEIASSADEVWPHGETVHHGFGVNKGIDDAGSWDDYTSQIDW